LTDTVDKERAMSDQQDAPTTKRRHFLKLMGLGGVAGAATLAAGAAREAAAQPASETGYHETAHVKKFYETARF
jgi:hypothetical protein